MFGTRHHDKFLMGNTMLFIKKDFFEEFNELLLELKSKNSRLMKFIE